MEWLRRSGGSAGAGATTPAVPATPFRGVGAVVETHAADGTSAPQSAGDSVSNTLPAYLASAAVEHDARCVVQSLDAAVPVPDLPPALWHLFTAVVVAALYDARRYRHDTARVLHAWEDLTVHDWAAAALLPALASDLDGDVPSPVQLAALQHALWRGFDAPLPGTDAAAAADGGLDPAARRGRALAAATASVAAAVRAAPPPLLREPHASGGGGAAGGGAPSLAALLATASALHGVGYIDPTRNS